MIYILIHTENIKWIQKYLPKIKPRCLEGEAEWISYAMLVDRCQRLQDLPQQYGMQFEYIDAEKTTMMLTPIDSLVEMNKRRITIGLHKLSIEDIE